ncbi:MAG: hypothetical protein PHW13_03305 [Methylococcales bacterium]|nr:hypothetical protein [Methylococcales bacterium]
MTKYAYGVGITQKQNVMLIFLIDGRRFFFGVGNRKKSAGHQKPKNSLVERKGRVFHKNLTEYHPNSIISYPSTNNNNINSKYSAQIAFYSPLRKAWDVGGVSHIAPHSQIEAIQARVVLFVTLGACPRIEKLSESARTSGHPICMAGWGAD